MELIRLEKKARNEAAMAHRMAGDLCRTGADMEPAARSELADTARAHAARALDMSAQCRKDLEKYTFAVRSNYYAIRDSVEHAELRAVEAAASVDSFMERFNVEDA